MIAVRRNQFALALVLTLALAAPASAKDFAFETDIENVTVYPDRARIERSGSKELPAGNHIIEIRGIPMQSMEESIQVSATGPKGAQLLGVEVGVHFESEALSKEVKALQAKVDAKQAEVNGIEDRRKGIGEELAFLKRLGESVAAKSGESLLSAPRIDVPGWKSTLGFLQSEHTRLNRELRELDPLKQKLQAELNALQLELSKLISQQRRAYRTVKAEVTLPSPGNVSVNLAYLTHGAFWNPRYEARVDTGAEKLQLAYGAEIRQSTGEDWKNVSLTLSTAQPSQNQVLPDLPAWYVNVPQPVRYRYKSADGADRLEMRALARSAPVEAEMEMFDEAPASMASPMAAVLDAGIATEFAIARKQTIASDGEAHRVAVQGLEFAAPLAARAVPKLEEAAFLTSRVENTSGVPLLPGALQVFRDGAFVGTSRIDSVLPGGTFDVSLGRDPRFTVEREYVLAKRDEGGFFSKKVTRSFHYRIKIKNFHKSARKIVVLDQIPVSQDGRIAVQLGEGTPPNSIESDAGFLSKTASSSAKRAPGEPIPAPGTLAWEYEVPAGGEQVIELKFTVSHDPGVEVEGL